VSTSSVVPIVAPALKALLTTSLATSGLEGKPVNVYDSYPGDLAGWDNFIIGDQKDGLHEVPTMKAGRKAREEEYIQECIVFVIRPGAESTTARTAAFDHLQNLEDIIANDPAIGLGATNPTLRLAVSTWKCDTYQDGGSQGWMAEITVDVLVKVRLT